MAFNLPPRTSSGRTIKPTEKFRLNMLKAADSEYKDLFQETKEQGDRLFRAVLNRSTRKETSDLLEKWLIMYEETVNMQKELQRLTAPEDKLRQSRTFSDQMKEFDKLKVTVLDYVKRLDDGKEKDETFSVKNMQTVKQEYDELINQTKKMEEEIEEMRNSMTDLRIQTTPLGRETLLSPLSITTREDYGESEWQTVEEDSEPLVKLKPLKQYHTTFPAEHQSIPTFDDYWSAKMSTKVHTVPDSTRGNTAPVVNIQIPPVQTTKLPAPPAVPPDVKLKRQRKLAHSTPYTLPPNATMTNPVSTPVSSQNTTTEMNVTEILNKLANAIADNSIKDKLPQKEPPVFDGDLLRFPSWLHSFETLVETGKNTDIECSYYLGVYTSGKAKSAIQGILDSKLPGSYMRAKGILISRFGDTFKTTEAYKNKLYSWPFVKKGDGEALTALSDFLWQCHNSMSLFGNLLPLDSPDENAKLARKLPYNLAERWARNVNRWAQSYKTAAATGTQGNMVPFPPFVEFCCFVTEESQIATGPISFMKKDEPNTYQGNRRRQQVFTSGTAVGPNRNPVPSLEPTSQPRPSGPYPPGLRCLYCGNSHHVSKCNEFLQDPPERRRDFARRAGLCYGCCKKGHVYHECTNKNPALLMYQPKVKASTLKIGSDSLLKTPSLQSMIVPVVVYHVENPYYKRTTYLILDNQADCCLVSHSLVKSLQLQHYTESVNLELTTANGVTNERSSLMYGLVVMNIDGGHEIQLPKCYTKPSIPANRDRIPRPEYLEGWPHLSKVQASLHDYYPDMEVGLLVGYNCSEALFPEEQVTGGLGEPFATRTPLGWGITGKTSQEACRFEENVCMNTQAKEDLASDLKRIFDADFDDAYDETKLSMDDRSFLQQLDEGVEYLENGHLQLPLPRKETGMKIPSNRPMALRRLLSLKRKLRQEDDFYDKFSAGIQKMIDKGFAEKVPPNQVNRDDGGVLYLPIQGVWHAKKIRDLRIVHDGGAIFQGFSLNDLLLTGPDLLNNLKAVLIRFRERIYAFTCDIEGMFMQVFVTPDDRDMLRFLWFQQHDIEKPIEEYRMTRHIFGASSSPGVTNYALCSVAKKHRNKYGDDVADFIIRHFYVDDGLKSLDTREEMTKMMIDSHDMCQEGGFNLHKYLCNDVQAMKDIPEALRASGVKDLSALLGGEKKPVERTLGMTWNFLRDLFLFCANLSEKPLTRRGMLSSSSSIFDPLGLLSPILIVGKLIIQQLCLDGYGWDDVVAPDLQQKWKLWYKDLSFLERIEIPRCIQDRNDNTAFDLHMFSDASMTAFGYCAYIRSIAPDGSITVNLLTAKAKVMPSKTMTVPRLELQAATLAARAYQFLKKEISLPLESATLWTDSSIVLNYLKNDSKRFQMFVANRVCQIQNLTEGCTWNHIATTENPADILSRGSTSWDLKDEKKWWHGPKILKEAWHIPAIEIPGSIPDNDPEVRKVQITLTTKAVKSWSLLTTLERFSNWRPMIRYLAIWKRYISNLKQKIRGLPLHLDPTEKLKLTTIELQKAENTVIRLVQTEQFPEIMSRLTKTYPDRKTAVSRKSTLRPSTNLYRLDVYLGEDGIMRVGGRIKRSNIPIELSNPIILPKDHHVTTLLIRLYHNKVLHAGRGITMNTIRVHGYWILRGRTAVSKYITKCVICRKLRGPTITQRMADLPPERVEPTPPFTVVGVDVCGPYLITAGRSQKKRWICAFTCFSSRAYHMEVLHSMTTDSFLHAYRRFVNRRGPARLIKCDQGSNFVGASRELKEAFQEMDEYKINQELAKDYCDFISFSFNSPKTSHMGGVWERMFRTARQGMNFLLTQHSHKLDDELFQTLVTEIESVINCRPLTCVDMNEGDSPEPISPSQLLTLKHKITMPLPGKFVEQDIYCRKRWRVVQCIANQFWNRWNKEFLPTLQERRKWQDKVFELQTDDLVLLVDESAPRNYWIKGMVQSTIDSHDGTVRRAVVRTVHGLYERPVHKMIFLFREKTRG